MQVSPDRQVGLSDGRQRLGGAQVASSVQLSLERPRLRNGGHEERSSMRLKVSEPESRTRLAQLHDTHWYRVVLVLGLRKLRHASPRLQSMEEAQYNGRLVRHEQNCLVGLQLWKLPPLTKTQERGGRQFSFVVQKSKEKPVLSAYRQVVKRRRTVRVRETALRG